VSCENLRTCSLSRGFRSLSLNSSCFDFSKRVYFCPHEIRSKRRAGGRAILTSPRPSPLLPKERRGRGKAGAAGTQSEVEVAGAVSRGGAVPAGFFAHGGGVLGLGGAVS
jgi:hypothetical protein